MKREWKGKEPFSSLSKKIFHHERENFCLIFLPILFGAGRLANIRDFLRLKFSFGLASRTKSENMAIPTAVLALLTSLAVPAAVLALLTVLAVPAAVLALLTGCQPARPGAPAQPKSTNGIFFCNLGFKSTIYVCIINLVV